MSAPPPFWLWTDLFAAFIALALAIVTLPTAFQMWWGRPRLRISFKTSTQREGIALKCNIQNEPIRNRLLKNVGVRREAANIFASYSITEAGTGKKIVPLIRPKIGVEQGAPMLRVTLPSGLPAIFTVLVHTYDDPEAKVIDYGEQDEISGSIIPAGEYEITVEVGSDARYVKKTEIFRVGQEPDKTYWH